MIHKKLTSVFKKKEEKKKLPVLDLVIDIICCWFITCAVVPLLYVQFIEFSLTTVFISAACVLILLTLITRIKWLLPAFAGTVTLGGLLYLVFSGRMIWFINYARGFFFWLFSRMNNNNKTYATETNYLIIQVAICIGVALFVFFMIRTSHSSLVVIGSGVLYFLFLLNGYRDYNTLTLMFLAVGYMPIIASSSYRKQKALHQFRKLKDINLLNPNWLVQITAIFLCTISIFASLYIVPDDTKELVNRKATNAVSDIQAVTGLYTKEQIDTEYKNLGKLNLQRFSNIGGQLFTYDKTQNEPEFKNEVIAYVYCSSSVDTYLKASVFEKYDGVMWESYFSNGYRLGSKLLSSTESKTFNKFETDNIKLKTLYDSILTNRTLKVVLAKNSNKLLVPSGMTSFKEISETKVPVLYNLQSEIFSFKNQSSGFTYEASYNDVSVNLERIKAIDELISKEKDEFFDDKEQVKLYTSLPDNYPLAVSNYAVKITSGATSDYQKVALLVQHLTDVETFQYVNNGTLKKVPEGTDITLQLLRSKRGNSVYYATALTTMARSLGIPSRLVAGYRLSGSKTLLNTNVWNDELGAYEISSDDAFCWTECYINGIGWIAFYPSPVSVNPEGHKPPSSNSALDVDNLPPLSEFDIDDTPEELPEDKEKQNNLIVILKYALKAAIYIAILVLALILLLLIRSLLAGCFSSLITVKLFIKNRKRQARYYGYEIFKLLEVAGVNISSSNTTKSILEKTVDFNCSENIANSFYIIDRANFASNYIPTKEDISDIYNSYMLLEKEVKTKISSWKYFLKRRCFKGDLLTYCIARLMKKIILKIKK